MDHRKLHSDHGDVFLDSQPSDAARCGIYACSKSLDTRSDFRLRLVVGGGDVARSSDLFSTTGSESIFERSLARSEESHLAGAESDVSFDRGRRYLRDGDGGDFGGLRLGLHESGRVGVRYMTTEEAKVEEATD